MKDKIIKLADKSACTAVGHVQMPAPSLALLW